MNANQIATATKELIEAVTLRDSITPSEANKATLKVLKDKEKSFKAGLMKFDNAAFKEVITAQNATAKSSDSYLAVKATTRAVRIVSAIGCGMVSELESATANVIATLLYNDGKITAKTAFMCLCKDSEYNELEAVQILRARIRNTAETAAAQKASARCAIAALQLATITKRKKQDDIVLTERGQELFAKLFA